MRAPTKRTQSAPPNPFEASRDSSPCLLGTADIFIRSSASSLFPSKLGFFTDFDSFTDLRSSTASTCNSFFHSAKVSMVRLKSATASFTFSSDIDAFFTASSALFLISIYYICYLGVYLLVSRHPSELHYAQNLKNRYEIIRQTNLPLSFHLKRNNNSQ